MRALQLDPVEAAFGAVPGGLRVAGDDLVDLRVADRLGNLAEQRVRHGRRCPHRQPGEHPGRLPAVVVDLREDRDAVPVDRLGDAPVTGYRVAGEAVDQLLVGPVRRVYRVLLGDDQAGAAGRPGRVVGGMLLGGEPVFGVVGQVRREHDPVRDGDRPEPQRAEQMAISAHRPALLLPRAGSAWPVGAGRATPSPTASAARRPSSTAS